MIEPECYDLESKVESAVIGILKSHTRFPVYAWDDDGTDNKKRPYFVVSAAFSSSADTQRRVLPVVVSVSLHRADRHERNAMLPVEGILHGVEKHNQPGLRIDSVSLGQSGREIRGKTKVRIMRIVVQAGHIKP